MSQRMVMAITGLSSSTIVDWNKFSSMTRNKIMDFQPKLVGTEEAPVKFDDSYFCGMRNHGHGRLLEGDKNVPFNIVNDADEGYLPDWDEYHPAEDDE